MEYNIFGIPPECGQSQAALFRSRIDRAYQELCKETGVVPEICIRAAGTAEKAPSESKKNAADNSRSEAVIVEPQEPFYTFDQLVLPETLKEKIKTAIRLLSVEKKSF